MKHEMSGEKFIMKMNKKTKHKSNGRGAHRAAYIYKKKITKIQNGNTCIKSCCCDDNVRAFSIHNDVLSNRRNEKKTFFVEMVQQKQQQKKQTQILHKSHTISLSLSLAVSLAQIKRRRNKKQKSF